MKRILLLIGLIPLLGTAQVFQFHYGTSNEEDA
jgi:hypothetical protein